MGETGRQGGGQGDREEDKETGRRTRGQGGGQGDRERLKEGDRETGGGDR